MGDLSQRLSRYEFACQCGCGFDTVDAELVQVLEDCADFFQRDLAGVDRVKIIITSGARCSIHNEMIGGSPKSQHVAGRAADFTLTAVYHDGEARINDDIIADYLELQHPNQYGIGRYQGRTHLDTRTGLARWDLR